MGIGQIKTASLHEIECILCRLEANSIGLEQAFKQLVTNGTGQNTPGIRSRPGDVDKRLDLDTIFKLFSQKMGHHIQMIILRQDDHRSIRMPHNFRHLLGK